MPRKFVNKKALNTNQIQIVIGRPHIRVVLRGFLLAFFGFFFFFFKKTPKVKILRSIFSNNAKIKFFFCLISRGVNRLQLCFETLKWIDAAFVTCSYALYVHDGRGPSGGCLRRHE